MKAKKILALFLSVAIAILSFTVTAFAIPSSELWEGDTAVGFAGGDGTKENPYQIANGAQLAYFAECVNSGDSFQSEYEDPELGTIYTPKYVVLTADIDLDYYSFPSIGNPDNYDSAPFGGCFDGQNHKITGFYNYQYGLFGKTMGTQKDPTSDEGRISNLHISGLIISQYPSADVGAIVGRAQGGVIENCVFNGSIQINDAGYTFFGGIVGEMEDGFVIDCINYAPITVSGQPRGVGGIVGGAEYNPPIIDGCINKGNISSAAYRYIGGVIGRGNTVINSANYGTLTASYCEYASLDMGGVAAYAQNIINCYNSGTLTSDFAVSMGSVSGVGNSQIKNSFNVGAISLELAEGASFGTSPSDDLVVAAVSANCLSTEMSENTFTRESNYPSWFYEDETNWEYVAVYDGALTANELKSAAFLNTLNNWVALNGSYSFEDYDSNTYYLEYQTWCESVAYPIFGAAESRMALELFTKSTDDTVTSVGEITMSGTENSFKAGETVTVSAVYNGNDHRFIGWYENNDFTTVISNSKSYSFIVTEEMAINGSYALTALYEKLKPATVTVNGGSLFAVNGSEYSSQYVNEFMPGDEVTVEAKQTEGFAYWSNTLGKIVSNEPRYTFTVSNDVILTAVYNTKLADKYTVIFKSDYGQVMRRQQLTLDEISLMQLPVVPVKTGYGVGIWSMDNAQIAAAVEGGAEVITVTPIYPEITDTAMITVNGGIIKNNNSVSGEFTVNTELTVTADAPSSGMRFAYWADEWSILSYNESYTFHVSYDTALTAVYVDDETLVEKLGTAEITNIIKREDVGGISFVASFSVPKGSKIDFAGIVATSDAAKADNLTADNADYVRGNAQNELSGRFTWTKSNAGTETAWYIRAYLVYTDENGDTATIYSSVIDVEYGML